MTRLDYSAWDTDKLAYFSAIQAGMAGNYAPMKRLVAMARAGREQGFQWASVMSRNLPLLLRRVRSIWLMLWLVSIAVELATARMIACLPGVLATRRGVAAVGLAGFMKSIVRDNAG